jgi:hypothetical protein
MAIPGETECREVAPCGDGDYGDIPVDGTTQFVNTAYAGDDSDGTQQRPWTTIGEGVEAAAPGDIVAVAAGIYPETLTIEKRVRLWGRCPALVELTGTEAATIQILDGGASATEIRDLSVNGTSCGICMNGAHDVLIDRVWVHDTGDSAIGIYGTIAKTEGAKVSRSLVEQVQRIGIGVQGSNATVEATVIRDVSKTDLAIGLIAEPGYPEHGYRAASLVTSRSVVERPGEFGVAIASSQATIESTVIREAALVGFQIEYYPDPEPPARATIRASIIERSVEIGAAALGQISPSSQPWCATCRRKRQMAWRSTGGRDVRP